jgi:K(+)-stimulated pyrophosphate-energized sodium pump
MLISVELLLMLCILLFLPGDYAGPCFIGFAIGESLGASALRIAGGIFTKIADIGSDLMKIVFNIKEDDARNPGVIADCTGDNAGDSVGPTADGFETYGVTGVALITFILIALSQVPSSSVQLLVWIFTMRIAMVVASAGSYSSTRTSSPRPKYQNADKMDFEHPLTVLVWLTSIVSVALTYASSRTADRPGRRRRVQPGRRATSAPTSVVEAVGHHLVRHARRRDHPRDRQGLHLDPLGPRQGGRHGLAPGRRVAQHPRRPHRRQLLGLLDGHRDRLADGRRLRRVDSTPGAADHRRLARPDRRLRRDGRRGGLRLRPGGLRLPRHGPGHHRRRLVRPGHRQRPVGLRAVGHRDHPRHRGGDQEGLRLHPDFEKAKHFLEENDGAGNTFKATAKPVLIGTAVVGATTMIFAIIMLLTNGLTPTDRRNLSMLHPPFLLGLITGGAVIYWFTGASTQAVSTGAYRAVEFIKANIKLDGRHQGLDRGLEEGRRDLHQYAQKGMVNIFLGVFFSTLAFAFSSRSSSSATSSRSRSSASTRRSSWPTPAAPGTTPRRSSRSS